MPNLVLDEWLGVKKWQNFDWPIVADIVNWSCFELFSDRFPRNHQVNWLQVLLSSLFLDQEWNYLIDAGPLLIVNNDLIAFKFKSFLTLLLTETYASSLFYNLSAGCLTYKIEHLQWLLKRPWTPIPIEEIVSTHLLPLIFQVGGSSLGLRLVEISCDVLPKSAVLLNQTP